jgi:hypothetical protein
MHLHPRNSVGHYEAPPHTVDLLVVGQQREFAFDQ